MSSPFEFYEEGDRLEMDLFNEVDQIGRAHV